MLQMMRVALIAGCVFCPARLFAAAEPILWTGLGNVDGIYRGTLTVETVDIPTPPNGLSFKNYVFQKFYEPRRPGPVFEFPKVEGELKEYLDASVLQAIYSGRVTVNVHTRGVSGDVSNSYVSRVDLQILGDVRLENSTIFQKLYLFLNKKNGFSDPTPPEERRQVNYHLQVGTTLRDITFQRLYSLENIDPLERVVATAGFPLFEVPGTKEQFITIGGANTKRGRKAASVEAKTEWDFDHHENRIRDLRWIGDLKAKFKDESDDDDHSSDRELNKDLQIDYDVRIPIGEGYTIKLRLSFQGSKFANFKK